MIGTDSNHCRIVAKGLAGERAIDEETFSSLAILSDRLERLKKLDKGFSKVAFSAAAKELLSQKKAMAVA